MHTYLHTFMGYKEGQKVSDFKYAPTFQKPFKVSYFTHELKGGADNEGSWKGEAMNPH